MTNQPWFRDPRLGSLFLIPVSWQGWAALGIYLALMLVSIPFRGDKVIVLRIAATIAYLGLSFLKSYRE